MNQSRGGPSPLPKNPSIPIFLPPFFCHNSSPVPSLKIQVAQFEQTCYGIVELVTEFINYDESAKNAFDHFLPKVGILPALSGQRKED
jgi:hypothetical protein